MSTHHNTTRRPVCRTRCFGIFLFALALFAPLGASGAQAVADSLLRVGTRVRVATVNSDFAIGVVHARTADSMTVAWEGGLSSTLTNAEISRIDVSAGPQPFVLRGMGFGFLGGAVVGAAIGAATYEQSIFLDFGIGVEMAGNAIVFGALGIVLGGVAGGVGRREGWSRVRLDRGQPQRVSVAPLLGVRSQGVRVAVRF